MTDPVQTSLISDSTTSTNTPDPATTQPPNNPEAAPDPAPADPTTAVETGSAAADAEGPSEAEPTPLALEDIVLPDGFEMPEEVGNSFLALINSPPESRTEFANSLIGIHTSLLESVAGEYAQQWETTQEQWRTEVQNLPEIGGQNLQTSLAEIAKVLDRYGDKEARDALAMTGAGNHPALVRLFHKIARDVNEKIPVTGASPTGALKDRATRMFGNSEG